MIGMNNHHARRQYLADLQAAHRGLNSDALMMPEPGRWPPPIDKRDLARQRLNPKAPKYWTEPPVDPVTAITTPAAVNPRKGSGPVTPEEIERFKAAQQAEFIRQLNERWRNNLFHL
jgi:hypothetical protein